LQKLIATSLDRSSSELDGDLLDEDLDFDGDLDFLNQILTREENLLNQEANPLSQEPRQMQKKAESYSRCCTQT
jgi:hypothetical protein